MGPINVALVKLFHQDQALREAQSRLDTANKNVRIQERKVADLAEKMKVAHGKLREVQARGGQLELDVKTREARIEKLRTQQQNANNNKEYQAFLIEISTEKIDRGKAEDELLKVMELIETAQKEVAELTAQRDAEDTVLAAMRAQIGERVAMLQGEVDARRPARDAAAAAVPPGHLQTFERLAERYDGEAMSALSKPDRRREEYLCSACNMDLVVNVYNRLHSRDDLIYCTSCGRILFIPEELPPEVAVNTRGKHSTPVKEGYSATPRGKRAKVVEKLEPSERRAKGKIGELLASAQGESVKITLDAGEKPVECEVIVDGTPQGTYKGKNAEHLGRIIRLRMEEAEVSGEVEVRQKVTSEPAAEGSPAPQSGAGASVEAPTAQSAAAEEAVSAEPPVAVSSAAPSSAASSPTAESSSVESGDAGLADFAEPTKQTAGH